MENIKTPAERADEIYHYGVKGMRWGVRHDDRPKSMRGKPVEADIENGSQKRSTSGIGGRSKSNTTSKSDSIAKSDSKKALTTSPSPTPASKSKGAEKGKEKGKGKDTVGDLIATTGDALNKTGQLLSNLKDKRPIPRNDVDLSGMSDKELRDIVNRYRLEEEYIKTLPPSKVEMGRQKTNEILDTAGQALGVAGSAATLAYVIWKIIKSVRGL